jgi:hypothetical protein
MINRDYLFTLFKYINQKNFKNYVFNFFFLIFFQILIMKTIITIKNWLFCYFFSGKKFKFKIKQLFRCLRKYFKQNFEHFKLTFSGGGGSQRQPFTYPEKMVCVRLCSQPLKVRS